MQRLVHIVLISIGLAVLAGCGGGGSGGGSTASTLRLTGLSVDTTVTEKHFFGDLWPVTWAADDRLYMAFGDGTGKKDCIPSLSLAGGFNPAVPGVTVSWDDTSIGGSATQSGCPAGQWIPGMTEPTGAGFYADFCNHYDCSQCYELCPFTPNGLVALSGTPPLMNACTAADQCVVARNVPLNDFNAARMEWVKTSSLIAIGNRLLMDAHVPKDNKGLVTRGYLAYSDDNGVYWNVAPGTSPWTETNGSHFRVLVFIQMGKAYADNTDGYLYAFGIDHELNGAQRMNLYLARVPKDQALDYTAWQYYQGAPGPVGDPCYQGDWSCKESDAIVLPNLYTYAQVSAMYHPGLGKYLVFSGWAEAGPGGSLFAADQPWGPWTQVGTFSGGFIGSMIPKGTGSNTLYFTGAGGGGYPYTLNLVKMTVQTN